MYPEFSIGFRWVLLARYGYKFDARVAKAANMFENDCPERCPCCYKENSNPRLEHWFSKCYLFREFRMKYFMDIDILHDKLFSISKYCPISNSNVNTVFTDINNVESNSDSDNSNEIYNYNNSNSVVNNSNSIDSANRNINISDSENNNIVINNVVNRSTNDNRINISNFLNNECVNIYCEVVPSI